ncbi:MAG: beta-lactamase family protein [Melioribacteraceae bacterium]|nr:MAG: beta-lactamase family protein [Melioribacteraceae bacterium]
MNTFFNTILILLLTLSLSSAHAAELSETAKSRISNESDQLIKKYTDLDIFSGVVLLAENGRPFYQKAFGLANRDENIPNTINTKFDIGSMNKTFTKVVVYQLMQEDRLKLDDKLGNYLEGFPKEAAESITINMLLHHQSGYGDYHSPDYFDSPKEEKRISQLVERIKKMPLLFHPGTDQQYSNAGYILLGAIIEKITGKSYHENVKERIVKPLELTETYVENKHSVQARAVGYFKNAKGEIQNNEGFLEIPKPDGGFQSTTSDILKFYQEYFYGNKLLSDEIKNSLDEFNYYDEVRKTEGAIPQAGGFEGANTVIYEVLRDQISIIVFANMDEPVAEQLGAGILAIVRGKEPGEPALPAIQNIYRTLVERSPHYVRENFEELTKNFHPSDPKDLILNQVGYTFLFDGQIDKAIEAFQLNVELFPNIANCYDSLGEALLEKGDREEALKNYKKALELNHEMPSAKEKVKELSK